MLLSQGIIQLDKIKCCFQRDHIYFAAIDIGEREMSASREAILFP